MTKKQKATERLAQTLERLDKRLGLARTPAIQHLRAANRKVEARKRKQFSA